MGAASAAAIGLTTLVTLILIGWVAAPHATFGEDIADVFRVAVQAWLIGQHAGFEIPGGHVGMLPIGLLILPGILLYRSGRWLARSCELPRLRHVFQAALALAGPYAAISGTLALVGQTEVIQPSMVQALLSGFLLAFVAGGLGVLRQLLKDKAIPRRRLLEIMPARWRSLLVGTFSATSTLLLAGTLLFFGALAFNIGEAVAVTERLAPGIVGGALLLLIQLMYLPNAIIFAGSYAIGPGFALGAETTVAPTGVVLGPVPHLPMLAALPESGPAPVLSLVALAAPLVAGGVGGALTLRSAPTVVSEAAPLWGFVCGLTTGIVWAGLAVLAGGPLGAQRLAEVGPSPWHVGLVTALEVGVAAAITAWVANWLYFRTPRSARQAGAAKRRRWMPRLRRRTKAERTAIPAVAGLRPGRGERGGQAPAPTEPVEGRGPVNEPEPEPVTEPGSGNDGAAVASRPAKQRRRRWTPRLRRRTKAERTAVATDEDAELYGITYEAGPESAEADTPRPLDDDAAPAP
ncbi:cell division protein PerM [Nocardiopsis ansamitocini]|nr:DUF6350 family protein [Nocardiopsis ansamitocini]